jgi:RNA polymerase sigma factor (sigma-70 family)
MTISIHEDRIASNYYQEVGRYPIPTMEEERYLFSVYKNADCPKTKAQVKQKIACGYLKFVIRHAHRKTKDPDLRQELIAEGNIGLMVAIDKFDLERGTRFLTYGASWIDVYMREYINRAPGVHIPNHRRKDLRKQKTNEDKMMALGQIREYTTVEPIVTSFDTSLLPSPDSPETTAQEEELNVLSYLIASGLSCRERFILIHYYGLRGGETQNFRALARLLYLIDGTLLSSECIRQLKEKSLNQIKEYLSSSGVCADGLPKDWKIKASHELI